MILFYILIQMLIQVYSPKLNLPPPHLLFLHCKTFEGIFERNIPVVKSLATIVSHQMPTGIHLPTLIKHPGQIFDSKLKRII